MSLAGLFKLMDDSGAGVKLMLVDACRDDPRASRGVDVTAARRPKGVASLFSCSAGERAYELDAYKHGVFFHHVLEVLKGRHPRTLEDNGDLTWDALQARVRTLVAADVAKAVGGGARQTPAMNAGELSGTPPVLLRVGATGPAAGKEAETASQKADDLYHGRAGAKKDFAAAFELYRKASDLGNDFATCMIAAMTEKGIGTTADPAKAFELYRKAADRGYPLAVNELGLMYAEGRGVAKDDAKAVELFRKAIDRGDAFGMNNLGFAYAGGRGVPKDEAKAVEWYRKAADLGNALAMVNLGNATAGGRGVPKDEAKAVEWYGKAADRGHLGAVTNLGLASATGRVRPRTTARRSNSSARRPTWATPSRCPTSAGCTRPAGAWAGTTPKPSSCIARRSISGTAWRPSTSASCTNTAGACPRTTPRPSNCTARGSSAATPAR